MESETKVPNAEDASSFLSKLLFCWLNPLFKHGLKNDLTVKDLHQTSATDLSDSLGSILERNWNIECIRVKNTKHRPSLKRALAKTFFKIYAIYGLIQFIQAIFFRLFHPIILAELIKYFENGESSYSHTEGYLLALAVVLVAFLNVLSTHHGFLGCQKTGMRFRVACCSLMYRKLLKLNRTAINQTGAGQVINLMSNDVQRFENMCLYMHFIWIMPIQAVVAAIIMFGSVGYPAILGIVSIAIQAIPLQGYLSKLQGKYRGKIAVRTDTRVKLMSEITSGIQIIKMYAWEKPFEKVVRLCRKHEIDIITKKSYIVGLWTALMVFTERTSLYITVVVYALTGGTLTSDLVFSMAQFFNTIQLYMSIFFPLGLASLAEASISVKRIEDFLLLPENSKLLPAVAQNLPEGSIKVTKGRASWIPNPIIDTLSNINLDLQPGTLCAVVGAVGSGKSSLAQLLLQELPLISGKMDIVGDVSYASQEPWLFVGSVRDNILFGRPYNHKHYSEVVRACALKTDFQQFPFGDKTLVGERGVSMSGGQRARINLARAVYRFADIYIFDDPLSAVDAHVGKQLFEKCIRDHLAGKTRILITHQLHYLKDVDRIIIVNNGQIEKIGTYAELSKKELLSLGLTSTNDEEENDSMSPSKRSRRLQSISSSETSGADDELDEPQETQELIEKGSIPTSLYWTYFHSGASTLGLVFLALLIILAQVVCNSGDLWLKHWTTTEEQRCTTNTTNITNATNQTTCADDNHSNLNYILIYTVLIIMTMILTTIRSIGFFKVCMNASKTLHNSMFSNILQATMRFFDTNPSGRILNRFSKDIGAIDEILPRCILDSIQIFMVMLGILAMVFIVSPIMVVPAVLLAVLFGLVRYVYMASAQDLKRLEGVTKAPVFSHVSESMAGLTTIRSSCAESLVLGQFDTFQDKHTSSFSLMISTGEAFGWYLDLISVAFLAVVTFQFFLSNEVLGGDVGLVISQSLILTGMLQHGMRQTTEVANNMTSVERVLQYTKLDKEGPFESTPTHKPHRDWPQKGVLQFRNVFLQYSPEEPAVLKRLNFVIKAGEKVGIVGRTGAGKSSLIAAIFRLAPIEGSIYIDELDTKEMGLNDLRSKISIIPQEPILFSTTIRNNLDPFDKCDDETLWKALENVELKDAIDKLEQEVSEGGSNFSAGQRQLICLARAIIRDNKIIILDEATANVDQQTDSLIQKTIRKNFNQCTVLTIAHRLNTVMDSDKVLVMDAGEAVEFDHPHMLLQKVGGELTGLVRETGDVMFASLAEVARVSYENAMQKEDETLQMLVEEQICFDNETVDDVISKTQAHVTSLNEDNKDGEESEIQNVEIKPDTSKVIKPNEYTTNKTEETIDLNEKTYVKDNKNSNETENMKVHSEDIPEISITSEVTMPSEETKPSDEQTISSNEK